MAFRLLLPFIFFITTICVNAQGNLPRHFESLPAFSDSQIVQDNYIDNLDHFDIQAAIQYGTITGETEYFNGSNWEPYGLSFETIEAGLRRKYFYPSWLPMSYYYNSEGKISEILTHQRERAFFTYDGNSNLLEILTQWITGINQRLELYAYDANNFLVERIIKWWYESDWRNSNRAIYTNNLLGLPSEMIYQYWDGNSWMDYEKYFYTYDINNDLIETTVQMWNNNLSTWVNNLHYLYTYNGDNLRTEYILQYWQNEQWVNNSKTEYFYDTNLNLTETKEYYWQNSDWIYRFHTTYSINENNSLAVIFPTPGEVFDPNSAIRICWLTLNIPNVDIGFSSDGGQNWEVIATNVPDTGDFVFDWTGYPLGIEYGKIKVADSQNPNIYAISYGYFRTKVFREYDFLTHNTNSVQFSIFNNGYLGPVNNYQAVGFQFNGLANTLYAGGIILSTPDIIVNGMIGSFNIQDFINYTPMLDFTSNNVFNQMSYTNIIDSYAPIPSGFITAQQTYSRENDDYVFVTYNVSNPTSQTIDNVFAGIFADWDIEDAYTNLGGVDPTNKIIYQYQPNASTDNNYYGIACLSRFSGAKVAKQSDGFSREAFYSFITNNIFSDITIGADYRSFIGSGPFTLNPGESVITGFVFLAASDITNLVNKVIEAQQLWDSGFTFTVITGLTEDAPAGSQSLEVLSNEGFSITDIITINPGGQNEETNTITGFGSLLLQTPLQFDHNAGELIVHLIPVGVEDNSEEIPTEYTLSQNYPNPFNPITSIRYSIPELSFVTIKIFDVLGSEIETLVNEEKSTGNYEVNFDASELASGIYFYRIKAGAFVETKKMVLIK